MVDRVDQLKRMLEAEPNDSFCLYSLGQEHAKKGDHAEAITWYDRAIAAEPGLCYAYFHKARAQESAGDSDGAVHTLRTGLHQARATGDAKATSELASYLDSLT